MNLHHKIYQFIANEEIHVGQTIIDPTTGTDEPTTVISIGPNSPGDEWFYVTTSGDRRIGSRQTTGWPVPATILGVE